MQAIRANSEVFSAAFAQRALAAGLILGLAGGLLGCWIVLRKMAFFTHTVGTGAYPGLVLAPTLGVGTLVGGLLGTTGFALAYVALRKRARNDDVAVALLLVLALASGSTLAASSWVGTSGGPETLLFGSVLTVDATQLWAAAIVATLLGVLSWTAGTRWSAGALEPGGASLGPLVFSDSSAGKQEAGAVNHWDTLLAVAVCGLVAVSLPTLGALMVAAATVIPAATARLWTTRVRPLLGLSVALSALQTTAGLAIALNWNFAPGATVALLAVAVFAASALARAPVARRAIKPATLFAALLIVGFAGCGNSNDADPQRPTVVATTPVVADLLRIVGADNINVVTLLPPGIDPHSYEPRPSDAQALTNARVIFRSGGAIDAWLDRSLRASESDRIPVDLSSDAVLREENGSINPHWYMDLTNVAAVVERVRIELTKAAPIARETYRNNAHLFKNELLRADRAATACLGQLPESQRRVVTDHNAFDYLAVRYKLRIAARLAVGNSPDGASARSVAQAKRALETAATPTILVAIGEPSDVANSLAKDTGAEVVELYGDTIMADGEESSVLGSIRANVSRIALAKSRGALRCAQ